MTLSLVFLRTFWRFLWKDYLLFSLLWTLHDSFPFLAHSFFVDQSLHGHPTPGRGDLDTMTWQLNMKTCGRTTPASRTTTGNEHKEKDKHDDRAGNHQRLYVTRLFVEPSAEPCQRNKRLLSHSWILPVIPQNTLYPQLQKVFGDMFLVYNHEIKVTWTGIPECQKIIESVKKIAFFYFVLNVALQSRVPRVSHVSCASCESCSSCTSCASCVSSVSHTPRSIQIATSRPSLIQQAAAQKASASIIWWLNTSLTSFKTYRWIGSRGSQYKTLLHG